MKFDFRSPPADVMTVALFQMAGEYIHPRSDHGRDVFEEVV